MGEHSFSRVDHLGNPCPGTLGEYRDLWAALVGDESKAVAFLDAKIAASRYGRDDEMIADDSQMMFLFAHLIQQDTPEAERG